MEFKRENRRRPNHSRLAKKRSRGTSIAPTASRIRSSYQQKSRMGCLLPLPLLAVSERGSSRIRLALRWRWLTISPLHSRAFEITLTPVRAAAEILSQRLDARRRTSGVFAPDWRQTLDGQQAGLAIMKATLHAETALAASLGTARRTFVAASRWGNSRKNAQSRKTLVTGHPIR